MTHTGFRPPSHTPPEFNAESDLTMSRASLHTHPCFDTHPGHVRRPEHAIRWQQGLPVEWQPHVVAPLYFDHYMDYELAAARILGRDEDDKACYCAYSFVLDGRGGRHPTTAGAHYAESVRAWRLRDGRWLTHRIVIGGHGALEKGRGFFSLGEGMPR